MVTATVLFAVTWLIQRPGYNHGVVKPGAWIAGVVAEATLAVGGYLGGTIVFVYGERVESRGEVPVSEAVRPAGGRSEQTPSAVGRSGGD